MIKSINSQTRRKLFLTALVVGLFCMAVPGFGKEARENSKKPNLVFVFSDQQSFDMLGCYGNDQIITPNIDRLASQGIRFNHCVSQCPVCTPYRGMLMSGQHPLYNGCFVNDIQLIPSRKGEYFGEVLRDAGYRMGYIGKWHLHGGNRNRPIPAGPLRYGFDGCFLSNNCTLDFWPGRCFYWNEEGERVVFKDWEVYGQTKQALEFIDNCKGDQPFALFVSWHPPHDIGRTKDGFWKYDTIDELMKLYDPQKIKLRPNVEDSPGIRGQYHGHMAMCSGVDIAFGRIMSKLKEKGLEDNTILVFTSDHGDLLSSHGRPWPKGFPEDESLRVPLIIRYPKLLPAGKTCDLLVGTLDLMPTLLGMLGLTIPKTCQGQNLTQHIVAGRDDAVESVPIMILSGNWRGVYTKNYTYSIDRMHFMNKPIPKNYYKHNLNYNTLYDKRKDPRQRNNLFDSKEHKAIRDKLHRLTVNWMNKFGDNFPTFNDLLQHCLGKKYQEVLKGEGVLKGRPIDILKNAGT